MIDLYIAATGNGVRSLIALEECGLPYTLHLLDRAKGEQRAAAFMKINPLGAAPVLVDRAAEGGPLTVTQSVATLLYVVDQTGKLLAKSGRARAEALECLMLAATDVAGSATQIFLGKHRVPEAERSAWVANFHDERMGKYLDECERRLAGRDFLAGDYSVADIVLYGTMHRPGFVDYIVNGPQRKNLNLWLKRVAARPAVQRAVAQVP